MNKKVLRVFFMVQILTIQKIRSFFKLTKAYNFEHFYRFNPFKNALYLNHKNEING